MSKPCKKAPKKKSAKADEPAPFSFAAMVKQSQARAKLLATIKPKLSAVAKRVIADPDLEIEDLSQEERLAVVIGLAERIVEEDSEELFERYNQHCREWREGASDLEVEFASSEIFPNVDEGYLDNLNRFLAVIPFLFVNSAETVREAAILICIHHPVVDNDRLFGPKVALNTLTGIYEGGEPEDEAEAAAKALAVAKGISGVMSCGDNRLLPLLEEAWDQIPKSVRSELAKHVEEVPTELEADFWLNRAALAGAKTPEFAEAIEHLAKMADGTIRNSIFADHLTRKVFNFGLEKGDDEIRKTTSVQQDDYLSSRTEVIGAIEAVAGKREAFARVVAAWGCTPA